MKAGKEKAKAVEEAALVLEVDLRKHREVKREEQAALLAEQERIKRQQQYLGAAMGAVEEARFDQQMLAMERAIVTSQDSRKESRVLNKQVC